MPFSQQLIAFVVNHWVLVSALLVILGLLTHNLLMGQKGSVEPAEATELINRRDALVVDVRPAADFATGHILNALNLPMNGFSKQLPSLQKHKSRPLVINCRSGSQSSVACQQLRKAGFEEVYNLRGGILAWENANLPLSRKRR